MDTPTSLLEQQMRVEGFLRVAGVDEAGAGALAGPLVAGAVILRADCSIMGLADSKQLSEKKREALYEELLEKAEAWGVGIVSVEEIAMLGLRPANLLAMRRAAEAVSPDFVVVDAWTIPGLAVPQRGIIRADQTVRCVAAASIIAKVTRDRLMKTLAEAYPAYGFEIHKGYGTALHRAAIKTHGPCAIHRLGYKTFREEFLDR